MEVNRAEGHRCRLLAAVAVWVHGRRSNWLGALGLQLTPCPHLPVVHLQQDQNRGEDDEHDHHDRSDNGSGTLIEEVFPPRGHVQRKGGVPQNGRCGHLDPEMLPAAVTGPRLLRRSLRGDLLGSELPVQALSGMDPVPPPAGRRVSDLGADLASSQAAGSQ